MICSICRETDGKNHIFREMMFGRRDEFEYWECSGCGCIAIAGTPERLADFYPDDYYSFSQSLDSADIWWYRLYFKAPFIAPIIRRARKKSYFADGKFQSIVAAKPRPGARILDVGCGAGHLVSVLRIVGFDAHGIDPFTTSETAHIRKASLQEAPKGWDIITFNHALEHMADHVGVLRDARERLASNGICLVRIPIAAWAWKRYGKNWVQLDAPRHLMIHSMQSFNRTAELAGFQVARVIFDSTIFQFVGSELYERDVPLSRMEEQRQLLTKENIRSYLRRSAELNRNQMGDQASFYLRVTKSEQ